MVACKDWHDIPAGPEKWIRMGYLETGTIPDVFVSYLFMPCYHCIDPVCLAACPARAINKDGEWGIVAVDTDACTGNEACDEKCLKACPYNAPQFSEAPGAKMSKCDFCASRWAEGMQPICVEACPTRALEAGDLEALKARYGNIQDAAGFSYSKRTNPAVIFRSKD
jgi:anaerobic dimethyl sulfoxide reductase subunit B (iron-sulfur subunit)